MIKSLKKGVGYAAYTLYLGSALSLAVFCLLQSQKLSHDQRARELAGKEIHTVDPTMAKKRSLDSAKPLIGEESD